MVNLTRKPASATSGGELTDGTQTVTGDKTFSGAIDAAGGFAGTGGVATTDNYGLVKQVKWQKRVLGSNVTSTDTDVAALRLSNLTIGNTYRVSLSAEIDQSGTSGIEAATVEALHDGSPLCKTRHRIDSATDVVEFTAGNSTIFVATATSVTVKIAITGTITVTGVTYSQIEDITSTHGAAVTEYTP